MTQHTNDEPAFNAPTSLSTLASRVDEYTIDTCRLLTLPTPIDDVVSFQGSFRSNPDVSSADPLVQEIAVTLLDKGTRNRDRFEIAALLENRGAQLHFSPEDLRVAFWGRALKTDLADVLALLAEQLREPLFDEAEFEKARAQVAASHQRALDSTGARAAIALSQHIYPEDHPNHRRDPAEDLVRLEAISVDDVRAYHTAHFGGDDLLLCAVGDVDGTSIASTVEAHLGDWPAHGTAGRFSVSANPRTPGQSRVPLPDKSNVDVRMGHALPILRQDDDYLPVYVGNFILGGNFSARLMTIVRDEMGLTYGIRSALSGITTLHPGHWLVAVTLSGENLERGIEATRDVVHTFVEEGVSSAELADKQTTITGSFKVGLATTGGLASALLHNAERGFDVAYLDRFPELVQALTLDDVNRVIREYLRPDVLHLAMSGTLPERA